MSRGLGKIERAALDALRGGKLASALDIAATVISPGSDGGVSIPEATYSSYLRALRSLIRAGLVADLGRSWHDKRRRYAIPDAAEAYRDRARNRFGEFRVSRPIKR